MKHLIASESEAPVVLSWTTKEGKRVHYEVEPKPNGARLEKIKDYVLRMFDIWK